MAQSARRSIKQRVSVRGTGLHTGATTEAVFLPAPAGQGVVFRRIDLKGRPEIPARLTEVEAVERRTAIGKGEAMIHTVEHLLAAVAEPPIGDGSIAPYFTALTEAQPVEVGGEPTVLTIQAPFTVTEGDSTYVVAPAKRLTLTVTIEWPHPLIGRQAGTYDVSAAA